MCLSAFVAPGRRKYARSRHWHWLSPIKTTCWEIRGLSGTDPPPRVIAVAITWGGAGLALPLKGRYIGGTGLFHHLLTLPPPTEEERSTTGKEEGGNQKEPREKGPGKQPADNSANLDAGGGGGKVPIDLVLWSVGNTGSAGSAAGRDKQRAAPRKHGNGSDGNPRDSEPATSILGRGVATVALAAGVVLQRAWPPFIIDELTPVAASRGRVCGSDGVRGHASHC
eukprot:gene8045-biopygen60